jgi:hypothetical protein
MFELSSSEAYNLNIFAKRKEVKKSGLLIN